MLDRKTLDAELREILGSTNVYFQPPASVKIKYPAIVYSLNDIRTNSADNSIYKKNRQYTCILIDSNPDSPLVDKFIENGYYFDRPYTADGLYHFSFRKYIK